ncbi:MAG: NPCBM/NEW2 domain-containing protein [Planctomycetaceae bacterium]|jgi:hypothetical protein|nr:NPCBM/NEW2 domain-containing protein [Planctomycetaceae bacterium]
MKTIIVYFVFFFAAACCFATETVYLDKISPDDVSQDHGTLQVNRGTNGKTLSIAGQTYKHGLGTHANSKIVYELQGHYERFEAKVGVDDAMKDYTKSSVVFQVFVDGEKKFDSGVMRINDEPKNVNVDLNNAETLELVVNNAGDGIECDHAIWADAQLFEAKNKTVQNDPDFRLKFNLNNNIVKEISGVVLLKGCRTEERKVVAENINSKEGRQVIRIVRDKNGNKAKITDRVTADSSGGYYWETEIVGLGSTWTTAIRRVIDYAPSQNNNTKIWTAWSNPYCGKDQQHNKIDHTWVNPFLPQPLFDAKLYYGSRPFNMSNVKPHEAVPYHRDLFCIPMLSYLESSDQNGTTDKDISDFGVTIAQNPSDKLLDLNLLLHQNGRSVWEYHHHRISKETPIIFRMNIVPHESDWRGGMRWMVKSYPEYFNPVNPLSDQIAGTASYSNAASTICQHAEKLHKMNYRVNWQASFDFPFFGMFIPPVADDVKWKSFGGREYSIQQYREEAQQMKDAGFYTLNYFNVYEVGTRTKYPRPPKTVQNDNDLWRNSNDFLYEKLGDAILMLPKKPSEVVGKNEQFDGKPIFSWNGSVILDCGVPSYREFLLEQAKLHIEKIPASSGICIDRLDWLRCYNLNADDNLSWYANRRSQSFLMSWRRLMEKLGPLMHDAGKVIYVNNHDKRLDVLKYVDGIYDEFTYSGAALNLTALLTIRKTALGWTGEPENFQPDQDSYLQSHLYLGVFPTAPVPGNDHTLRPSPEMDRLYIDYGRLFALLAGKKWVLQAHCIEVKNNVTNEAVTRNNIAVNLFETPQGYIIPVCFAKGETEVVIRNVPELTNAKELKAEAFYPAEENPAEISVQKVGNEIKLQVPVKRNCAMVKLTVIQPN